MVKTPPSNLEGMGLLPGQLRSHLVSWPKKTKYKQQKKYCNKFNKDFKNGPHLKKSKNIY